MKILIVFVYLIISSYSYAIDRPDIDNIVINKNPKTYNEVFFKDINQKDIYLPNN